MFTGKVQELNVGSGGMTGTDNLDMVEPTQLTDARNITYARGTISKEFGAAHFNAVTLGAVTIIGGWDWWPTPGTHRVVVLTGAGAGAGGAFKDDNTGAFAVDLTDVIGARAWTSTTIPIFVEGGKELAANNAKLFIFTGVETVYLLSADGAELQAIAATAPADWAGVNQPYFGVNHEGRLWAGGNTNQPHRLYYSVLSDFEDFQGAGSGTINVFPGDGQRLVAGVSFKGKLIIFKYPYGVYSVDTSDPIPSNWRVERLSNKIGIVGPRAYAVLDNDILFCDPNGTFRLLSAVTEFGDVNSSSLSAPIYLNNWMSSNISQTRLTTMRGVYYPARREAHFTASSFGGTTGDRRLIWDFNTPGRPRFRYNDFPTLEELFLKIDGTGVARPCGGDTAGFVWLLDQTTKATNGAAYAGLFQIPPLDLSQLGTEHSVRRKNGRFLELSIVPTGNWNLSADIFWDGNYLNTLSFSMGSSAGVLGSFVIGTGVLSGQQALTVKRRMVGSGIRLQIGFFNQGTDEDFSISKMLLHYDLGNDTH